MARAGLGCGRPAMSDSYFDIILFAMVAVFLGLRLRAVLGRRTGTEQRREPLPRPAEGPRDNIVALPERRETPNGATGPAAVESGLAAIRTADPSFDPDPFLKGARGAFAMIVNAFAAGETATLRPLLSDEVYERFNEAIRTRLAAKETHETRVDTIKSADLVEASLNGRTAFVTIRFVSDQVNVTRAADGTVVDGDPDRVVEKTDFWTFARNTRSQDPNWLLVATRSG
jgi:predicted lipid-binding transport protein (Tim44 family)